MFVNELNLLNGAIVLIIFLFLLNVHAINKYIKKIKSLKLII